MVVIHFQLVAVLVARYAGEDGEDLGLRMAILTLGPFTIVSPRVDREVVGVMVIGIFKVGRIVAIEARGRVSLPPMFVVEV